MANVPEIMESTGIIEAVSTDEEYDSDVDIGYVTGSERASTFNSEIFDFRYENGRRYHGYKEGRYALPNDEEEQFRLDIVHYLCGLIMDGELHAAPLALEGETPSRILDVGTGTGIWAIEMATKYEAAEVIGTDLSPIQPTWVPPNCRFDIDDAEGEWIYTKDSFDFIHSRHLSMSIIDWPSYISKCYEHLKPGGWLELSEHENGLRSDDNTYQPGSALHKYWEYFWEAMIRTGKDPQLPVKLTEVIMDHGGFIDVNKVELKLPWGSWPKDKKHKEAGKCINIIAKSGFEAYGIALFTGELGKSHEEVVRLIDNAMAEIASRKIHAYQMFHTVIARKPLNAPPST